MLTQVFIDQVTAKVSMDLQATTPLLDTWIFVEQKEGM
jgi:hypothetical protein